MARLNARFTTANLPLARLGVDPEAALELLRDTLLSLNRVCTSGTLTRGDAAILAGWEEVWQAMDALGQDDVCFLEEVKDVE